MFQDPKFAALFAADGKVRQMLTGNGSADGESLRLVSPPPFVFRSFRAAEVDVVMTTPAMVGAVLRQRKGSSLTRGQAKDLLTYLLDGFRSRKYCFKNLIGLKVAPLHKNGLGTFQARTNSNQFLYLCPTIKLLRPAGADVGEAVSAAVGGSNGGADGGSKSSGEQEVTVDGRLLMPDFPHFIDPDFCPDALEALRSQISIAQLNILPLNMRALASNMEYVLPAVWRGAQSPISLSLSGGGASAAETAKAQQQQQPKGRGGRRARGSSGAAHQPVLAVLSGTEVLERLNLFWSFVDGCGERVDFDRMATLKGWPVITARTHATVVPAVAAVASGPEDLEPEPEPEGSELYAMSMDVARSHHVLSRELYSAEELRVLDRCGVLFLTTQGASDRLTVQIQGMEKISPAMRAIATHWGASSTFAAGGGGGVSDEQVRGELCEALRDLIIGWSGETDQATNQVRKPGDPASGGGKKQGKKAARQQRGPISSYESVPESVLRQLPIFETIDHRWVAAASSMGAVQISCAPSKPWETLLRKHAPHMPCLSSEGKAGTLLAVASLVDKHEEEFLGVTA